MSEFHFRRVAKIVLAWGPQQGGPETKALLGGITAGECDPRSRSEKQGKEAGGGAVGAATPSHQDCLSGRVTCVSELPAEGMMGSIRPPAIIPRWPRVTLQAFAVAHFWVGQPLEVPWMTASGCTSSQSGRTEVHGGSHTTCVVVLVQKWSGSAWN